MPGSLASSTSMSTLNCWVGRYRVKAPMPGPLADLTSRERSLPVSTFPGKSKCQRRVLIMPIRPVRNLNAVTC